MVILMYVTYATKTILIIVCYSLEKERLLLFTFSENAIEIFLYIFYLTAMAIM
jgi:hypothetical protein